MATPFLQSDATLKVAGDIASAFLRANADKVAGLVIGNFTWLRAPITSLVIAIADAVDKLGEKTA